MNSTGSEIYLYDGNTVIQLTNNSYDDFYPKINNRGQVAWNGFKSAAPEIFFYDGIKIIQITNNETDDFYPQINDRGQIVWEGYDNQGPDGEIYFYNGSSTIRITNDDKHDFEAQINNDGQLAWIGLDNVYNVYTYNGTSKIRITDSIYNNDFPVINNRGQIAWQGWDGSDMEIYLHNTPSLSISPASGDYVTTQKFDVTLILKGVGFSVTQIEAVLDGQDISGALSSCVISGTLLSGSQTLRCPNVPGNYLGEGFHTVNITLGLNDGTSVSNFVTWNVLANTEP